MTMNTRKMLRFQPDRNPEQPVDRVIGARVRTVRKLLGLRQRDLAIMLKVSQSQIGNYESGRSQMKAAQIMQLGKAMGVPINEFFDSASRAMAPRNPALESALAQLTRSHHDFCAAAETLQLLVQSGAIERPQVRNSLLTLIIELMTDKDSWRRLSPTMAKR